MTTDDLAGLLYRHQMFDGLNFDHCECGERIGTEWEDMAAHQAAVIAAAGWVRLEDLIEWFETEDPETLNGDDREFETVAVYLRAFKDCEPVE